MTEIKFLFLEQLPQTKRQRRIKASRWKRFDWGSSYSSEALSWIEFKEELCSQEAQLADCTKWVWHEEFSHSEQKPGINNFDRKFPHKNVHLFKWKFVQWFHCFLFMSLLGIELKSIYNAIWYLTHPALNWASPLIYHNRGVSSHFYHCVFPLARKQGSNIHLPPQCKECFKFILQFILLQYIIKFKMALLATNIKHFNPVKTSLKWFACPCWPPSLLLLVGLVWFD